MPESRPLSRTWHYLALWLLAIASLAVNLILIAGLLTFRARAREELSGVAETLGEINAESFELPVEIDERIPISMTVPFEDTFFVPISATVPVSTSVLFSETVDVPIDTVIPVNTTVNVPIAGGLGAGVSIPIPIVTNIPVRLDVEVPISRTIRIQTDIPVNLDVVVPVASEIPIQTDVPVMLQFPVTIPLEEFGLNVLITQVRTALEELAVSLGAAPETSPAVTPAP